MTVEQLQLERRRSVGQIVSATAGLYRRYPLLFAILALAVIAPYQLAVLAITGNGPLGHANEGLGTTLLLGLLRTSLITPLVSALHIHAVVTIGEGRKPRLQAVALRGVEVLPVVAAAEIMSGIGIALGFLALVIPGVLLGLRWAVTAQAASLEHEGWLAALRSSARLAAGRYWHVFALQLFVGVLSFAAMSGARAIDLGSTSRAASVAVGVAVDTLVASFAALTLALLYFDLRSSQQPSPGAPREHAQLRDLD